MLYFSNWRIERSSYAPYVSKYMYFRTNHTYIYVNPFSLPTTLSLSSSHHIWIDLQPSPIINDIWSVDGNHSASISACRCRCDSWNEPVTIRWPEVADWGTTPLRTMHRTIWRRMPYPTHGTEPYAWVAAQLDSFPLCQVLPWGNAGERSAMLLDQCTGAEA